MKEVLKMKMENFEKNYLHHWKSEGKIRRKQSFNLSNNFLKYFLFFKVLK